MESKCVCDEDGTDIGAAIGRMLHHRGVDYVAMDTNPVWVCAFESLIEDGTHCPVHPRLLYVPSQHMAVITTERHKLGAAQLRQIQMLVSPDTIQPTVAKLTLVTRHTLSMPSQKIQDGVHPVQLTVLPWSLLMTYPLDHTLVPPHRRASPDEICRLLGCPNAGTTHHHRKATERKNQLLPCLRMDDPIAQYLGMMPGEIVRIDRLDGSIYYRVIVRGL